jgi:hypothetical protein
MDNRHLLWAGLALWVLVFAGSFVVPWLTPASGDGFTRGLNRITGFFGWQLAAGVVAVVVWVLGSRFGRKSAARRISRLPAAAFGLLVVAVLAVILAANFRNPAPHPEPPGPVTAPTAPAMPLAE